MQNHTSWLDNDFLSLMPIYRDKMAAVFTNTTSWIYYKSVRNRMDCSFHNISFLMNYYNQTWRTGKQVHLGLHRQYLGILANIKPARRPPGSESGRFDPLCRPWSFPMFNHSGIKWLNYDCWSNLTGITRNALLCASFIHWDLAGRRHPWCGCNPLGFITHCADRTTHSLKSKGGSICFMINGCCCANTTTV